MFAVIGCGYWGFNHIRVLHSRKLLKYVYDINSKLLGQYINSYDLEKKSFMQILKDEKVKVVIIATESDSHLKLIKKCMSFNKVILVEKPIVSKLTELLELKKLIKNYKNSIYVGHLMTCHNSIIYLKNNLNKLIKKYGKINSIETNRCNFGKIRKKENSLISFIPHDLSIISYILNSNQFKNKNNFYQYQRFKKNYDKGTLFFDIKNIKCICNYSWISLIKKRELTIYFEKAVLIFDDLKPIDEKIQIFKSNKDLIYSKREQISSIKIIAKKFSEPLNSQLDIILNNLKNKSEYDHRIDLNKSLKIYEFLLK